MGKRARLRKTEVVTVQGAALWTVFGGTGTPLVLCHGGPGLSDNLGPVAEMVDDLAVVHRFDQRGSGYSRSDGPFNVESCLADLEALRAHWGHDRWIVGGHSWGANLALFYALTQPERTLGVIYISGTGLRWGWQQSAHSLRMARLTDEERLELEELREEISTGNISRQERFLQLLWSTDFADRNRSRVPDSQPLYRFPRNDEVFRSVSNSYKAILASNLADKVRTLQVPVLVLHGEKDTDPARAREIAELAPLGTWVELPDTGHSPWLERAGEVKAHLRNFLSRVRSRDTTF